MSDNAIRTSSIRKNDTWLKVVIYVVSIFFSIMTLFPFLMMFVNCFKSSDEVQQSALAFWSADPFGNFKKNFKSYVLIAIVVILAGGLAAVG